MYTTLIINEPTAAMIDKLRQVGYSEDMLADLKRPDKDPKATRILLGARGGVGLTCPWWVPEPTPKNLAKRDVTA